MRNIFLIILFLEMTSRAWAAEDICPGGSSPRSDIVYCMDFDTLGSCSTGQEAGCVSANGLSSLTVPDSTGFKILSCPDGAAVGTGCIYGSGKAGGTGPGYSNRTISPSLGTAGYRHYIRFDDGYTQSPFGSTGNHITSFSYSGGGCSGIIGVDVNAAGLLIQIEPSGSCGANQPSSYQLTNNIDNNWVPQNNRWYLFEAKVILNTTSSSSTGIGGGNGTVEFWIDGVKRVSHTNLNLDGSASTAINDLYAARSYYAWGVPSWKPTISFDNFAISNDGTYIGPATAENSRGTADASSPYVNYESYVGFEGSRMASDCSSPASYSGSGTTGSDLQWGGGFTYVTSPAINSYVNNCTANARAAKAQTTSLNTGAGMFGEMLKLQNRYALHSKIYLDGSNDYASDTPVLCYGRYGSGANTDYGLCLGRNAAGNWMLWQKSNPTITKTDLGVAATTNAWHEVELHAASGGSNGKYSVYVDGVWIKDEVDGPVNFWSNFMGDIVSPGIRRWYAAIFQASPATTFNVYYDDLDSGNASFVSSKGWGTSNPFEIPAPTPTPTPTPVVSGSLSVIFPR